MREQMSHEVLPAEQWPLFRIRATPIDEQRTRLHLSFDALIADAWSVFLLMREWLHLYNSSEFVLPSLELSFRDYVLGEATLKNTPQYQRSQEYWFHRLDSLPPAPELPLAKIPMESPILGFNVAVPNFRQNNGANYKIALNNLT